MLKLIVQTGSNEGDLVLDAIAGSGTTLIASALLNRKAIGIDNSEVAAKAFVQRVMRKHKEIRGSFRVLRVDRKED